MPKRPPEYIEGTEAVQRFEGLMKKVLTTPRTQAGQTLHRRMGRRGTGRGFREGRSMAERPRKPLSEEEKSRLSIALHDSIQKSFDEFKREAQRRWGSDVAAFISECDIKIGGRVPTVLSLWFDGCENEDE